MSDKKVSIIIVNYNGQRWLSEILPDLNGQIYQNLEVVVVDNGSSDNSLKFVKENFPKVKVIGLKLNHGFAQGNNFGFKKATGEYIIFLNNDTRVDPQYVSDFVSVFTENKDCQIAQSKIVYLSDNTKIDTCGSFITPLSYLYYVGNDKNEAQKKYNQAFKIFSTKGASMIVKREVIEKIGLFDKDFWSYYEETDFCHRAWLSGYQVWYWPKATVSHAIGGTSLKFANEFVQFHNFKNKLASFLINFEVLTLLWFVPMYLITLVIISIFWLFKLKFSHVFALLKSLVWNLIHFPQTLQKRKDVQSKRTASDGKIFHFVMKSPRPSYYWHLLNNSLGKYVD